MATLLNDTGNGLQLFRDTAAPSVAIAIQGNINIMTQDGFRAYSVFEVNGYTGSIKDIVYTSTGIVLLIDQEIIALMNESTSIHSPSGLTSSILENNVFHITGRGRDIIYDNYDIVIAWSHTVMLLYVSIDGGKSFSNVTIPISRDNITIQSLQVHPVKDEALMFYTANNNQTFFLHYDVRQNEWSNATVSNGNGPEQLLVKYFPSPFGDLIVWGRQSMYYSLTGDDLLPLSILQNHSSEYQWRNDEYIRHVDTGSSGQIALVLSDGSLFYGRIATGQLLKILYYVNENSTIFFDSLGNLKFLSMLESGSISVRTVPVYSLLLSALYPPLACPYLQWTHNIAQSNVYYIDIRDTFTVWVSLVPRVWSPNNISVSFSNVRAINKDIQSTEEQTALQGSVKRNMSITVTANNSTGYTVMKLSPVTHSLTCDELAEENVEIFVACPPERHIRITRGTTCTESEDYTYTIPSDHYDSEMKGRTNLKGLQDKVVRYNVRQWGCPIRVLHNENYKPVLFLYDGSTLNERVGVDFVVREIHGRTDFSYTATADDVGCRRAPQTWQEILANAEDPYKAWTPQNYQNCFEGSGSLSSSSAKLPYQILNSSNGGSYIQWGTRNGVYVFEATVIAKDYSFCNLTVLFAVQVYSVQNLSYIAYILFVVTCMTSGVVLFLSFLFYKRLLYTGNLLFKRQTSKTISSSKSNSGQL
ncbi:PREDICTED: uncharacterized protein C1orf101-like isoform X1 [Amphimedon queenslandica]|uniref:CATSPERD/E C-terminal domain-containing protein n=1 Tax=Amphimedon queenslandica TaxID=400682 RepID=A0AAN0J1A7_AMPQE|nr:PREDICTED: uncharacterized protein C1orf101-like isoform X1 [Amphimedon queenslandica]|eukprot:XP_019850527.1 PREDICTED: uncharacterized protein C1orf101-like isoform X1 [Amphimedon queenslandica]